MKFQKLLVAAAASAFVLPALAAAPSTSLTYTSSPASWVGHGETVEVDPATNFGFQFQAARNFDNGVSFSITDFATNPDFQNTRWWYLDFAGANGQALHVGDYDNATRFPFQDPSQPGLSFIGNGRGDNQLTGSFSVLSVSYAADGTLLSFDATFEQFDENIPSWWNIGEIRYNVSAVPETDAWLMLGAGLAMLGLAAARSRRPR